MKLFPEREAIMDIAQETLLKLSAGDHQAFKGIFRAYYARIRAFAYGFLKNTDEADELAQMVFVKLWDKREMLPRIQHFDAYLFTLTKHTIFNFIEARHLVPVADEDVPDRADEDTPYEELVAHDLQLLIDLTVEHMPPQRRQIFRLSRREGLSNEEIAERMGIQKKTVENHLNLALKELRDVIGLYLIIYIMLMH